ncbi:hypothetical protein [Paenibacillus radicis (ex Xue et al. 2023)]|uniref:YfhD family protein n=1 Tax=Paenibacillus radicis (ex Xue et al. 2023) TaxID=2972489 RepID=A0ABT1YN36_9BACL|nr:hypothetical protein [Paenibacillus radicis (ex Xue et al. 2023)]MCR8633809.1 hypothetical protein [Paenibacillus radicis (ex Xue et al. 2023)]
MVQKDTNQEKIGSTDSVQQDEAVMSRAQFNAANEKLIEDQLQISEDKLFDYVPGEEK